MSLPDTYYYQQTLVHLNRFFAYDLASCLNWLNTDNNTLGGVPVEIILSGEGNKVLEFVQSNAVGEYE